ncbi:hypothetical protein [Salinigranum marinum]|uniref:hypothetical protein n=1 Tax=Salinigranum marinum TaxID=1515595 RepID=UPI002989DC61|nr:hypothetical protein [Salinigranum marinum]
MTDTDTEHDPSVARWRDGQDVDEFESDVDTRLPARTETGGVRDAIATRPHDRLGDVRTHPARR